MAVIYLSELNINLQKKNKTDLKIKDVADHTKPWACNDWMCETFVVMEFFIYSICSQYHVFARPFFINFASIISDSTTISTPFSPHSKTVDFVIALLPDDQWRS